MINQTFNRIVKGKSIALIGGSDTIDWPGIISCELQARVNDHQSWQGGRCDILYYSCASDLRHKVLSNILNGHTSEVKFGWLNFTHTLFNGSDFFQAKAVFDQLGIPRDIYFHGPPQVWTQVKQLNPLPKKYKWSKEISEMIDGHAFTGLLALGNLLLYDISCVVVTGMNFFREKDGTIPKRAGAHNIANQIKLLKILSKDKRVILDHNLLEIINK